jgi:lysozyme
VKKKTKKKSGGSWQKRKKGSRGISWKPYFIGFLLLGLLAGLGAAWLWYQNRYPVKGIDVSRYQGKIDWPKVRGSGLKFAFIKATEGLTLIDTTYVANWAGAGNAGISRGAYHFFRPSMDGQKQAVHFLKQVKFNKGDLPPVLDLESTDDRPASEVRKEALKWLRHVEAQTGMKPIVYTLPHFAASYLNNELSEFPLWVVSLKWWEPEPSKGWDKWTFWQHSHTGGVAGIKGNVDLNVFNGSFADFEALKRK